MQFLGIDILHGGHKSALEFASSQVDKLFVLVNSDKSIKTYKGKHRPYNNYSKRKLLNKEYPSNIYIQMHELTQIVYLKRFSKYMNIRRVV